MKYFSINELCCSGSHPNLVEVPASGTPIYNNLMGLIVECLDPVREALGAPITVYSGYRPPKLNNAVNGSKTSAHLAGLAADLQTKGNNLNIVKSLFEAGVDFDQVIIEYPSVSNGKITGCRWVHIGLSATKNRKQCLVFFKGKYWNFKNFNLEIISGENGNK